MKKMLQSIMLITLSFIALKPLTGQIFVPPGENTLYQAVMDAYDGDILQLAAGGTYTESAYTEFGTITGKSITIEAEEGASEKPKVIMQTEHEEDESIVFFKVGNAGSLTLKGIEFDGAWNYDTTNYLITFDMGEAPQPITVNKINVQNCIIKNLVDDVIGAGNSEMKYNVIVDSTIVDNCIIHHTATSIYMKYAGTNYIQLTNSTLYNINSYGIRICGPVESGFPDNTPTVLIDHTTWYKIGVGDDQREIIQGEKGPLLNPWTVTNSIFVNQISKTRTFINIKDTPGDAGAFISGLCYWDIGAVNFRSHTVADTLRMDPEFADPDNGDFTLPWNSPTFNLGTDGGPIGDPRWTVNSVSIDDNPVPHEFKLKQNYPNPFNPTTIISFQLSSNAQTSLIIYNVLGVEVQRLVSEKLGTGTHQINFDGSGLNSGVYFYTLTSGNQTQTRKMMLIK
ncbi:MAG: T9SS type A sorting domain-containing protein [Candidatus Marinimicrobia bacterium]|nr:T9SS type A sorting domain-containing protein [Candidatus Neomarinimicrobiota bacterium]